jgi:hypothetical protein
MVAVSLVQLLSRDVLTKTGQKSWIMAKRSWSFSLSEADLADHADSVGLVGPG